MATCLFCSSTGPFTTKEHVIPESLGNDDLILLDTVCDACQRYFGSELEQYILNKSPFAFWRTHLGIRTKKGKLPSVDVSQPKRNKGIFPSTHSAHDNVGYTCHEDGSVSVDIDDHSMVKDIISDRKTSFQMVFTPKLLFMVGRFLCKVGIELLCHHDKAIGYSSDLDHARRFARFGQPQELWPIFHFNNGTLSDLKECGYDEHGYYENAILYDYAVIPIPDKYLLFRFTMGTDNFVICLNDPFPTPEIVSAFPGVQFNLIYYPTSSW